MNTNIKINPNAVAMIIVMCIVLGVIISIQFYYYAIDTIFQIGGNKIITISAIVGIILIFELFRSIFFKNITYLDDDQVLGLWPNNYIEFVLWIGATYVIPSIVFTLALIYFDAEGRWKISPEHDHTIVDMICGVYISARMFKIWEAIRERRFRNSESSKI